MSQPQCKIDWKKRVRQEYISLRQSKKDHRSGKIKTAFAANRQVLSEHLKKLNKHSSLVEAQPISFDSSFDQNPMTKYDNNCF